LTRRDTPERSVLLHAHMFKNAGTTLDWSLKRCFGTKFVDHRDDKAMRNESTYLSHYLQNHPHVSALSSHWLPIPPIINPATHGEVIMLLRNPLERCRSVFNFERAQESNSIGNIKARELPFRDYVRWRLQPGTGPVIKNFHTRFCSGDYFGNDNEALFSQAKANLDAIPLVGVVHRYAESMVLFEQGLHDSYPDIDLSWQVQNTSQSISEPLSSRIEAIKLELGDVFHALVEANQYDIALFQYAEDKFERALGKVTDLSGRITSINQRNELLS
jgi:hypothetical protein